MVFRCVAGNAVSGRTKSVAYFRAQNAIKGLQQASKMRALKHVSTRASKARYALRVTYVCSYAAIMSTELQT